MIDFQCDIIIENTGSHALGTEVGNKSSGHVFAGADMMRHSGADLMRHSRADLRHSGADLRYSGADLRHSGADLRHCTSAGVVGTRDVKNHVSVTGSGTVN